MKPSQHCIDFIAHEEGLVLHSYQDRAGVWTIGYGSTMFMDGTKPKPGEHITEELAKKLLAWEVENKTHAVNAETHNLNLRQSQFDALVSFTYNVGVGGLKESSLLRAVKVDPKILGTMPVDAISDESIKKWFQKQNLRAIPMVAYHFTKWCKITKDGKKIFDDGLIGRRMREAKLYQS